MAGMLKPTDESLKVARLVAEWDAETSEIADDERGGEECSACHNSMHTDPECDKGAICSDCSCRFVEEWAPLIVERETLIAQARAAERTAIVAWMRAVSCSVTPRARDLMRRMARRIESGAHLASGASGEEKNV